MDGIADREGNRILKTSQLQEDPSEWSATRTEPTFEAN